MLMCMDVLSKQKLFHLPTTQVLKNGNIMSLVQKYRFFSVACALIAAVYSWLFIILSFLNNGTE